VRRWLVLALLISAETAQATDGEYLFHAAGCLACHTREGGPALAGGRPLETPFGVFYTPNISPDAATGIGGWSKAQFIQALKHGTAPDGRAYYPAFPYPSYRLMTDEDLSSLFDYLRTRPPQHQVNREHELPWWLARWMIKLWQRWVLDDPEPEPAAVQADPLLSRGRYLVDALGHCGECHTPRNWLGVSIRARYLAGNANGPEGDKVPNITPDRHSGIGKWDADDLQYFLKSGEMPNGDYVGSVMTEVIDNATSKLTAEDRRAMTAYLRSVRTLPGG